MKKFLLLFIFSITYFANAQQAPNRFDEDEPSISGNASFHEINNAELPPQDADTKAGGPGNPDGDDDLPIDDYVPLLIVAAVGIIVYKSYTKNKALS